jgi:hypothetical protein
MSLECPPDARFAYVPLQTPKGFGLPGSLVRLAARRPTRLARSILEIATELRNLSASSDHHLRLDLLAAAAKTVTEQR